MKQQNKNQIHRREFLKTIIAGGIVMSALPLFGSFSGKNEDSVNGSTLFFQPSLLSDPDNSYWAWSNSIVAKEGKLYMFIAVMPFPWNDKNIMGLTVAESHDGVHWTEFASLVCPIRYGQPGFALRWTGQEFVYFVTESNLGDDKEEHPNIMRQYRSTDIKTWEFMGTEYSTCADQRWYRSRWDELAILENAGSFFGYITSEPKREFAVDSCGMLTSTDGIRWKVAPPPVIDWDGLPPQQMEVGFCE